MLDVLLVNWFLLEEKIRNFLSVLFFPLRLGRVAAFEHLLFLEIKIVQQAFSLSLSYLCNKTGLKENGQITIDGVTEPFAYTYILLEDSNNGRTIAGFSKNAKTKMYDCFNFP